MDDLTFISEVLRSVAWPVTVLASVYILRSAITGALGRLRGLQWKELNIDFQRELAEARELTVDDPLRSLPLTDTEVPVEERQYLLKLAEISPRALVIESWAPVEAAARQALMHDGQSRGKPPRASALVGQALADAGILSEAEFQIFTLLRNMRNSISHDPDAQITAEDALQYAVLADHLTQGIAATTSSTTGQRTSCQDR